MRHLLPGLILDIFHFLDYDSLHAVIRYVCAEWNSNIYGRLKIRPRFKSFSLLDSTQEIRTWQIGEDKELEILKGQMPWREGLYVGPHSRAVEDSYNKALNDAYLMELAGSIVGEAVYEDIYPAIPFPRDSLQIQLYKGNSRLMFGCTNTLHTQQAALRLLNLFRLLQDSYFEELHVLSPINSKVAEAIVCAWTHRGARSNFQLAANRSQHFNVHCQLLISRFPSIHDNGIEPDMPKLEAQRKLFGATTMWILFVYNRDQVETTLKLLPSIRESNMETEHLQLKIGGEMPGERVIELLRECDLGSHKNGLEFDIVNVEPEGLENYLPEEWAGRGPEEAGGKATPCRCHYPKDFDTCCFTWKTKHCEINRHSGKPFEFTLSKCALWLDFSKFAGLTIDGTFMHEYSISFKFPSTDG